MKATIEITNDFVRIYEGDEEIVGWVSDEWDEDPSILPSIANAILIASGDNGIKELKRTLGKLTSGDYVSEENRVRILDVVFEGERYEVQWNDRDKCSDGTFGENVDVEKMSIEDYDRLMDFVRKELSK